MEEHLSLVGIIRMCFPLVFHLRFILEITGWIGDLYDFSFTVFILVDFKFFKEQLEEYSQDLIIQMLQLNMTNRLIESGLSDFYLVQVRTKVECFRSWDHLVPRSRTDQLLRSHPQASRVTTHSQQVASLAGFLPFCRSTVSVFHSSSWQGSLWILVTLLKLLCNIGKYS